MGPFFLVFYATYTEVEIVPKAYARLLEDFCRTAGPGPGPGPGKKRLSLVPFDQ